MATHATLPLMEPLTACARRCPGASSLSTPDLAGGVEALPFPVRPVPTLCSCHGWRHWAGASPTPEPLRFYVTCRLKSCGWTGPVTVPVPDPGTVHEQTFVLTAL